VGNAYPTNLYMFHCGQCPPYKSAAFSVIPAQAGIQKTSVIHPDRNRYTCRLFLNFFGDKLPFTSLFFG